MNAFWIAVASGLVVLIIAKLFGLNNSSVVVSHSKRAGTAAKVCIVIGWIMIWGGAYYALAGLSTEGPNSVKFGAGLSFFILGLPVLAIGKFAAWWSRF